MSAMQAQVAKTDLQTSLDELFEEFIQSSTQFSRRVVQVTYDKIERDPAKNARSNLMIAKTIFSKWVIEIMTVLYQNKDCGFEQLRKEIEKISPRMLSLKLSNLQKLGLVRREVLSGRPPRVNYSLTKKGLAVARLGEPVFLFLRFQSGLLFSDEFSGEPFY